MEVKDEKEKGYGICLLAASEFGKFR